MDHRDLEYQIFLQLLSMPLLSFSLFAFCYRKMNLQNNSKTAKYLVTIIIIAIFSSEIAHSGSKVKNDDREVVNTQDAQSEVKSNS